MKRHTYLLAVLGLVLAISALTVGTGCNKKEEPVVISQPPEAPTPAEAPAAPEQPAAAAKPAAEGKPASGDKTVVKITTPKGVITCELFDKQTPISAGNFLLLTKEKFYDGLMFHRIEPGFCAQGGDPTGTGAGGPGYTIPDELVPELKHDKGMLSMAKTALPDTGGSQFFICLGGPEAMSHLDMKHSLFGKVTDGYAVAEKLEVGDKMEKVEIVKLSPHAEKAMAKAKAARKPE